MNLNYSHLYYFFIIAREGSIRDAAKVLHLTQSTLSNQLKDLETFFGSQLFTRASRGLILNEIGKAVLSYAQQIFKLGDELTMVMKSSGSLDCSMIRVGLVSCLAKTNIERLLCTLWGNEDVIIRTKSDNLVNLIKLIETHEIDLILSDRPIFLVQHKLKNIELGCQQLQIVGAAAYAELAASAKPDLNSVPFCTYSQHSLAHEYLNDYFTREKVSPKIVGEVDDINLLQSLAQSGKALVALPSEMAEELIKARKVIPIGEAIKCNLSLWGISPMDSSLYPSLQKSLEDFVATQILTSAHF